MKTKSVVLCMGFVAACGQDYAGVEKVGQNKQAAACFTCKQDTSKNKVGMASFDSDWYANGLLESGHIVEVVGDLEYDYVFIKRRDRKTAVCAPNENFLLTGVAYFDHNMLTSGDNSGSTIKVETCDSDTVLPSDWVIGKYIYNRDPDLYGKLEFMDMKTDTTYTQHSWYKLYSHKGSGNSMESEGYLCADNPSEANWVMFIPGRIELGNLTTTPTFTSFTHSKYNAEAYMSANYLWDEQQRLSLSCGYKPTECILSGHSPALLLKDGGDPMTYTNYTDMVTGEEVKGADSEYEYCITH